MIYRTRIHESRPEMSKSFSKLADFLLDYYIEASFMTATEIAQKLDLDAATVVRFSQYLGFTGFPQLLREIQGHVKQDLLVRPKIAQDPESIPGILENAMGEIKFTLEQTQTSLNTDALTQLVDQIGSARRIIILAEGPAQQQILHQQGFSIASVADILEKVKDDLPKIAQEAGVDIIVSKWEVVYKNPSIEIVDVTSHLVKLFDPSESELKIIEKLREQPPIPLLELLLELPKEK